MNFSSIYEKEDSFSGTVVNQALTGFDIEQASIIQDFSNKELVHYESTDMNLKDYDNVLMNKYYEKIKNSCQLKQLSTKEKFKYNRNPELMSTDFYGTPSLWYLLMYINGCESIDDFYNLEYVLVPQQSIISKCLVDEEYILSKKVL